MVCCMEAGQLAQKTGKQSACPAAVIVIVVSCRCLSFGAGPTLELLGGLYHDISRRKGTIITVRIGCSRR
jgi:hypothetical protein